MSSTFYVCWLDDKPGTIDSYQGQLDLLKIDHGAEFIVDPHYNADNFDSIARNIDNDLIFFIDYNLKQNDGEGIDGHEVIELIRQHNQNCRIIFYSSKATQEELRALVKDYTLVICVLREQLIDILNDIADGSFFK
jgi:CheY-like chemotaxis protein